jgi:glycosyltransferase involved in cell wall biosynthesis
MKEKLKINNKHLRICLISYRSNPHCGGQGVYIRNLSRGLTDLGHSVDVVSGPPGPLLDDDVTLSMLPCLDLYNPEDMFRVPTFKELCDPVNLIEWLGVSTMGFPETFTFGLRAYRYLKDKFHKYDIVHDNQCLSYGIWAINRRMPTVVTIHHPITVDRDIDVKTATSLWEKIKLMRWYSFIETQKRISRTFSHIITVSKCARQDICRDFNIQPEKFRIVPNGISTDIFYPIPEIMRQKNNIIVTNSADTPLKGLYYLLRAVTEIAKTRKIRLTVVGTPKKDSKILKLIAQLGIGNLVTFTGRISDKQFVLEYAKAAIAVIPSVYEGFGLPAGEAMACGVPVISTAGGALPEVVGDAGVIVPHSDYKALAGAISQLFDNPQRARELGQAGYKRVMDNFTWKIAAQKTVDTYREAILDHRRF